MNEDRDRSLAGKFALITGAARRVGAAITRRLHAGGADVAIHYRGSETAAGALADELNARRGDSARLFHADLGEMAELTTLVDSVGAWTDGLDILINNASSFYPTPIGTITEAQWDEIIGSNLKAPLFLSQALAPQLRANNGVIVNIVDIHARRPLRDHAVYGAAKAGLGMLTRSLAKDLAPDVRVNGIAPGAILWPESGLSDDARRSILEQIPLARTGDPEDIANCALYLVRDATYVTGQIISVDGGRSIGW